MLNDESSKSIVSITFLGISIPTTSSACMMTGPLHEEYNIRSFILQL